MKLDLAGWTFAFVLLTHGLMSCTGCQRDRPVGHTEPHKTAPSASDLLAFQQLQAQRMDSLIEVSTSSWHHLQTTGTGIRWQKLDSTGSGIAIAALQEGTLLELHHRISLLDGHVITDWADDGPMAFEPGSTDLPSGFHELIQLSQLGDSLRAMIPPIRAWGMSGLPPDIPQEAIIVVEMRADLYQRPS
ncbi:FKBP-type peptidyl-prolyl cis-trans isomerase [Flavobacteriales bacterium]|nr:FKBP-type peptidyl-prolyl cis-trans isomerase [Flavobacteriales bacterium]